MVTASQIQDIARHSAAEVILTDGRTFMIHSPEHVGRSPSGRQVVLPSGEDVLVLVEVDDIAAVRVAALDPDVEMLRAGEIPGWMRDRMREHPDLFVRVARMEPEELARALGWGEER